MVEEAQIQDSYYRDNIPDLISDLKIAVQNNRQVITQEVKSDIGEDKYVNVLKSRRMAADDTIHFLKEIDRLERELMGVEEEETGDSKNARKIVGHPSKTHAKK